MARGRTRLSDLQIHSFNTFILLKNCNWDRDKEHRSRQGYFTKQGIGTGGAGNKRRCWLPGSRGWCTAHALCKAGTSRLLQQVGVQGSQGLRFHSWFTTCVDQSDRSEGCLGNRQAASCHRPFPGWRHPEEEEHVEADAKEDRLSSSEVIHTPHWSGLPFGP